MALPRTHRLKKGKEIGLVLRKGGIATVRGIVVRYGFRGRGVSRFAFVVSRKDVKKSVIRNAMRRRAAEWVRKNIAVFSPGFDVVFIFHKEACGIPTRDFSKAIATVLRETPLLNIFS